MNKSIFRLINRSLYIYLVNWTTQVNTIKQIIETAKRKEANMKKAISKTINRSIYL
jgi:uncharacterized protein with GYD domain